MNTGPRRNTNSLPRMVSVPVRSDGKRSGVNCTRRPSSPMARTIAAARSDLATPGGPSMSTWPPESIATSVASTSVPCPTTTLPTSWCSAARRAAVRAACAGSNCVM